MDQVIKKHPEGSPDSYTLGVAESLAWLESEA